MMKKIIFSPPSFKFLILTLILIATFDFYSCKKSGCRDPEAINFDKSAQKNCDNCCVYKDYGKVVFHIDHQVDGQPLQFDTMMFRNPFNRLYGISKLIYYVSDFTFYKADGSSFKSSNIYYVDGSNDTTLNFHIDGIPNGAYTSISFLIGINKKYNVNNGLAATPENQNMIWPSMQGGGYYYMKLEGTYLSDSSTIDTFLTHFGIATEVIDSNHTVYHSNYAQIVLQNIPLMIDRNIWHVNLLMNINEWYEHPHDYDFPLFGQNIIPDYQAQIILRDNGADVFSVSSIQIE